LKEAPKTPQQHLQQSKAIFLAVRGIAISAACLTSWTSRAMLPVQLAIAMVVVTRGADGKVKQQKPSKDSVREEEGQSQEVEEDSKAVGEGCIIL
jgi:hypothetical protein